MRLKLAMVPCSTFKEHENVTLHYATVVHFLVLLFSCFLHSDDSVLFVFCDCGDQTKQITVPWRVLRTLVNFTIHHSPITKPPLFAVSPFPCALDDRVWIVGCKCDENRLVPSCMY